MEIRISYLESLFQKWVKKILKLLNLNYDNDAFVLVAHVTHIDPPPPPPPPNLPSYSFTTLYSIHVLIYCLLDLYWKHFTKLSLCIVLSDILL